MQEEKALRIHELLRSRKDGKFWGNDDSNPALERKRSNPKASLATNLKGFDDEEEDVRQ